MRVLTVLAVCSLATGCTAYGPGQVAPPNAISVKNAFDDVADGLLDFRRKVEDPNPGSGLPRKIGVVVCRVIVHFNIAASASQTAGVGAALAVPIQAFKGSLDFQEAEAAAASRGNSVVVDLGSINNDVCATYEKASDMYPSPVAAAAQTKGDQANTQGQSNNQGNGGTSQGQSQAQTRTQNQGQNRQANNQGGWRYWGKFNTGSTDSEDKLPSTDASA